MYTVKKVCVKMKNQSLSHLLNEVEVMFIVAITTETITKNSVFLETQIQGLFQGP